MCVSPENSLESKLGGCCAPKSERAGVVASVTTSPACVIQASVDAQARIQSHMVGLTGGSFLMGSDYAGVFQQTAKARCAPWCCAHSRSTSVCLTRLNGSTPPRGGLEQKLYPRGDKLRPTASTDATSGRGSFPGMTWARMDTLERVRSTPMFAMATAAIPSPATHGSGVDWFYTQHHLLADR